MNTEGVASDLLGYAEVCRLLGGVNRRTVWRWYKAGHFPPPVSLKGSRLARWRRADVLAFLAALPDRADAPAAVVPVEPAA